MTTNRILSLKAPESFRAPVRIHIPGGKPLVIEFEFRWFLLSEFQAFLTGPEAATRSDLDAIKAVCVNWYDVDRPMNDEALTEMLETHHGAAKTILQTWAAELRGEKLPVAA